MKINTRLIAHNDNLDLLLNKFNNNFHHSWLFSGIKGIGKYKTAIHFIKTIYGDKENFDQQVFKVNNDENFAMLDDIRILINQISLTNSDHNTKSFIIIDNADSLNFNSFNALLKTIEEPPNNTVIIIICHDVRNIPKTIISRCIKLNFQPLNINELQEYCNLKNLILDNSFLNENYNLIGGSIEKLLILTNKEGKFIKQKLEEILENKELKISEFEEFYDYISKDYSKSFRLIFDIIFTKQKIKFIESYNKKPTLTKILNFFSRVNYITNQNLNIGNKKELFYLLTEYINTNNNEI